MRATQMLTRCQALLGLLDSIEGMILCVRDDERSFIYDSVRQVQELARIAKFESDGNVTRQQAQHLLHIVARTARILKQIPHATLRAIRRANGD